MKRLLLLLALLLPISAFGQALLRNSFTTNSVGKTPNLLATSSSAIYPLMVETAAGADRDILTSVNFYMTGTNAQFGGALSLNARTNRLTIANGVLLLDGVQVVSTAGTPINNFYATNIFVQNGSHNTMVISNSLTIQPVKTNMLATTSTGLVTNANYGSGISWDPTTLTLSSTASGGAGVNTHVTALTWSGTNITGVDCITNGESFYLLVTNNCLFGSSTFSNLPAKTAYQTYTLCLQMDSTGGYVVSFTNSIVDWTDGVMPIIKTNANAVSYIYFHSSLVTNSMLVGTPNINVRNTP